MNNNLPSSKLYWLQELASKCSDIATKATFVSQHGALAYINKKEVFAAAHNDYRYFGTTCLNGTIHAEMNAIRNAVCSLVQQYILQGF